MFKVCAVILRAQIESVSKVPLDFFEYLLRHRLTGSSDSIRHV